MKKRFIEVSFPFTKMSELCQKEKPAVSKTLSTLHLWWSRKPLTLSRAVIASCILPAPNNDSERKEIEDLLGRACTLDAGAGKKTPSPALRELVENIHKEFRNGQKLSLLDPFAGGGSIPFEARRLGLDVFANDLNPVSYLLRKVGVELVPDLWEEKTQEAFGEGLRTVDILDDFDKWSDWLYKKVKKELAPYFDKDVLNYLWVKTCHCKSCGREIPLLSMKVSEKKNIKLNPKVTVNKEKGSFKIELTSSESAVLRTRRGVICPFCEGLTTTLEDVKNEGRDRGLGYFPICKYVQCGKEKREFLPFTDKDLEQERKAQAALEKIKLDTAWSYLIPNERAPSNTTPFPYGLDRFDKFYSPRQLLTVVTLIKYVRQSATEMEKENMSSERTTLIVLLLSFLVDKFAIANSTLTSWQAGYTKTRPLFAAPQYWMTWDFAESSPIRLEGSGSFGSLQRSLKRAIKNCMIPVQNGEYNDNLMSVTNLKYRNNSFDLIITDPPYYDYAEYSSLSDFFYVLLKRMIKKPLLNIFKTPLTPKNNELILKQKLSKKDKEVGIKKLEIELLRGWKEVARVLKRDGILVVMFTHRSTDAWEQLFLTLHKASFYAVATWPVLSERLTKYSQERANVNVTLLIVCRKRDSSLQTRGDYRDVLDELRTKVYEKAKFFFEQGLSGADFFVVIQGPAMEIFAKYDRVEKSSGEQIGLSHFIRISQRYVSEFILGELFNVRASLDLDPVTRFYVMWRWSYGISNVSVDNYLLFCKVNSTSETYLEELEIVKKVGKKKLIHLNQYFERDLPWENWKFDPKDQSVITKLHLLLLFLDKGNFSSFTEFLEIEGINDTGHIVVQVARVLEMLLRPIVVDAGYSIPEHAMLQKFLDNRGVSFIKSDSSQKTLV